MCREGFVSEGDNCVKCKADKALIYVPTFGIVFLVLLSTAVTVFTVVVCTKVWFPYLAACSARVRRCLCFCIIACVCVLVFMRMISDFDVCAML
jgi:hypothetical protein